MMPNAKHELHHQESERLIFMNVQVDVMMCNVSDFAAGCKTAFKKRKRVSLHVKKSSGLQLCSRPCVTHNRFPLSNIPLFEGLWSILRWSIYRKGIKSEPNVSRFREIFPHADVAFKVSMVSLGALR